MSAKSFNNNNNNNPGHYQHNSYINDNSNIVHNVDSSTNMYRAPLPQPLHSPQRQTTMWDLNETGHYRNSMGSFRRGSENVLQPQRTLNSLYPYQPMTGAEPLIPSQETVQQVYVAEPDEDPMQHLVLVPLGKTGAGKSSLLNIMLGYDEFKAKAAAKSVTDCITERTGVWGIDQVETIITIADTPGFADSMQRDLQFLDNFQDYIMDVGTRLGIDAFLLVFQCNSPTNNIMAILDHFNKMMEQKFLPNTWWKHVMLVFTRVDYYPNLKFPTNILLKKQSIIETVIPEIQKKYNLSSPPKYAFVSSKAPNCSFSKKGQCDCFAATKYHLDQMRTLKSRINAILTENGGRWMPA